MRPVKLCRYCRFALAIVFGLTPACTFGNDLTVVSWGGAYAESQRKAFIEPFMETTGTNVTLLEYSGGLEELRNQQSTDQPTWDVIDLAISDNIEACDEKLLEPFDADILTPAPDNTAAQNDFIEDAITECGITQLVTSTVIGFNEDAYPIEKPQTIKDFFDLERFPGKRGLQRKPIANLEWALMAYDVPLEDLYNLLSTERGLKLAFTKLNSIKSEVKWWTRGSTPAEWLTDGTVSMSSGYNGRLFNAMNKGNTPIAIIWDGQLYEYSTWGIVRGSKQLAQAKAFIAYATSTEPLAKLAQYITYGPARKSSQARVWNHAETGIKLAPHLPTNPINLSNAIRKDNEWYASTQTYLIKRFDEWLGDE